MNCRLSLRAYDLAKPPTLTVSGSIDPFAVVTLLATTPDNKPKCLGRTEAVHEPKNPEWSHNFNFLYDLGTPTKLNVQIFTKDRKGRYHEIGSTWFDAGLIIESVGAIRGKRMEAGGIVVAQLNPGISSGEIRLKLKGVGLRSGWLHDTDPFYQIFRRTENREGLIEWESVYQSKVIRDTINPIWPEHIMDLATLCDEDLNRPIRIAIYDYDKTGKHELLGEIQLTTNQVMEANTLGLDEPRKAISLRMNLSGRSTSAVGKLMVLEGHVHGVTDPFQEDMLGGSSSGASEASGKANFLDYIIGGCEVNVCFAIDFTGSNGDPMQPGTLHFLGRNFGDNDYEKSIIALLNVLGKFDSDRNYSVWGFGAKYNGEVYNIFQCGTKRFVPGIGGVLQTYRAQFRSGLTMADTPTALASVFRTAIAHSRQAMRVAEKLDQQSYTILIVLTDGDVDDMDETLKVMDEANDAPLSIVMVGIGEQSFPNMKFVDDGRMGNDKKRRDFAQFVLFDDFSRHSQKFTREALQEIPQQVVDYFHSQNIPPLPPPEVSDDELEVMEPQEIVEIEVDFDEDRPYVKGGGTVYHDIFTELLDE